MKWLPTELTSELHALTHTRATENYMINPHAYKSGYYQALINGLPDTPENREHIENTIKRLKEKQ